jgi:cytosine/adenosine deaminase-related metal-dependent hydrolase
VLPLAGPALREGAVAVADGRVLAVGPADEVAGPVTLEWPGVLIPGLVNAHAHLEYGPSFAELAGAGLPFPQWLAALLGRRRELSAADFLADATASAALALATGTTSLADVVTIGPGLAAAAGSGLGGVSYAELAGVGLAGWPVAGRDRLEALLALDPGPARSLGVSPHTLFTLAGEVVRELVARAREAGLRLHPHLAETAAEDEFVRSGTGPLADAIRHVVPDHELLEAGCAATPTARLDQLGGLGPDVHVAHGVHLDAADRALLRRRATAVALCVRSNAILGAGEPPVAAYRREGNPVALGTDSLGSSPDLDLLAECRAVGALARRQGSPVDGLDDWVLAAATRGGAAAMGLPDAGRLRPGARADLVLVDADPAEGATGVLNGRAAVTVLAGAVVAGRESDALRASR